MPQAFAGSLNRQVRDLTAANERLRTALERLIERFQKALIASGTDAEMADAAVVREHEALERK